MSFLFYRRPDYVPRAPGSMDQAEYEKVLKKQSALIPPQLSFDMIVANRAMPPCSLEDFMGYLLYVSHEAENLQFYLWLQDYTRRFDQLPSQEQVLSPRWKGASAQATNFQDGLDIRPGSRRAQLQPNEGTLSPNLEKSNFSFDSGRNDKKPNESLTWQPFTIQPCRSEIDQIIAHYLTPNGPRELNISHKARTECLHALQHTTHPSALAVPAAIVTATLQTQSHPNFIRWSIVNGNQPRMIFGKVLGTLNIIFGFLISILLLLSYKPRWWRLWSIPAWLIGFTFLLAGSNGICFVLYVTRDRHARPWEQFADHNSSFLGSPFHDWRSEGDVESDTTTLTGSDSLTPEQFSKPGDAGAGKGKPLKRRHWALEAFGTANSYGHEVWVDKYRAKMMFRKIFDTQVWVKNESLRILQDKVAYQAIAWSVIVTVPLTVAFVAAPGAEVYR